MGDKKIAQIAVHLSEEQKCLVCAFAEMDSMTTSEYVTALIEADIGRKSVLKDSLCEAFAKCDRTGSSGERL